MVAMTLPAKPWTNGMMTADGTRMFDSTVGSEGAWRATPIPAGGLPAGSIIQWSSNTAPPNWFIADGSAISRTLWPSLFAVIGTTYGSGDGSTTFNLPDLRGRVAVGAGSITDPNNNTQVFTLAGKSGELSHKLTVAEMPAHTHNIYPVNYTVVSTTSASTVAGTTLPQTLTQASSSTGGDGFHNNLQPYLVTNYIIKATTGWSAGDSELALRMAAVETSSAILLQPGRVAQVQKVSNTNSYSTTTNTPVSIGISIPFTPKYSNSLIILDFTAGMVRKTGTAGSSWIQGLVFKDGAGVGDFSYGYGSSDNYTGGYMGPMTSQWFENAGSKTARTYEIKVSGSGVGTQWVESLKVLTIWEITQ